jgi:hypothetical protein
MAEDGGEDVGVENEGEDAHLAATPHAAEWIDLVDPREKLGPSLSHCPQRRPVGRGVVGFQSHRMVQEES